MGATPVEPAGFEANRADALAPGTHLDGYEIERVIGASGFGFVYLAYDPATQRRLAIKEYLPDTLAVRDEDGMQVLLRADSHIEAFDRGRDAFIEEAQLLARCHHPSLLHVTRSWQAKGTAYRAMPYYPGNSLFALREAMDAPPDEPSLRALLDGLLGALETLHDAGVVHREVSPWNILLLPDDTPILLDFNAARRAMVGDRARALMSLLTPTFAPIELTNPAPERPVGPWTDLHSLAEVVRYCVSGELPRSFTSATPHEPMGMLLRRMQLKFPRLQYSPSFLVAIDAALALRPEDRPQSVEEFRRRLEDHPPVAMSLVDEAAEEVVTPVMAADEQPLMDLFREPVARPREDEAAAVELPVLQTPVAEEPAVPESPFFSVLSPTPSPSIDRREESSVRTAHFAAIPEDRPAVFDFAERARRVRRRWGMVVAVLALIIIGGTVWWVDQQRVASAAQSAFEQAVKRDVGVTGPGVAEPAQEVVPAAQAPVVAPAQAAVVAPAQAASQSSALPVEPARAVAVVGSNAEGAQQAPAATSTSGTESAMPLPTLPTPTVQPPAPAPHKPVKPRASSTAKPATVAGPREACGARTDFSLYRCMKTQCAQAKWQQHPSCKRLRERDEVG